MSEISEDLYCAGWLYDLEFELWEVLQSGSGKWHGIDISAELSDVRALSDALGGWHDYDRFIPLDEWLTIYANRRR